MPNGDPSRRPRSAESGPLREVPYMGVIWVVAEAARRGFRNGDPDWCNLGQGQPEVGEMEDAPPRLAEIRLRPEDHAYGPLEGIGELREAIAETYNRLYRRGCASRYRAENVAVASGGRLALTRAAAALGSLNIGYVVPDYTAYEDLLGAHLSRLQAFPVRLTERDGFRLDGERFERERRDNGLAAFLLSNPCNPTGSVLAGDALADLVARARRSATLLLLDEFYSHFHYDEDGSPAKEPVSAARFVEDVEKDPVLLFDGLTKGHRYPGWRVGWVVGPSEMVETLARTASAIDGGPSIPAQRLAIEALDPDRADRETAALRRVFAKKREETVRRLRAMGLSVPAPPRGTFYCWASLAGLSPPFDDAFGFFRRALERRVLTVPGPFFDVDPGRRRPGPSPLSGWMRFSFGPKMDNLRLGLSRLEEMLRRP